MKERIKQNIFDDSEKGEIVFYKAEDTINLEVRIAEDTVWLSQSQMVELFRTSKQNVSLHISNIYKEGELSKDATIKEYLTVQTEGNRQIKRVLAFYNLDVIISVGYRVKSIRGTKFRQWATCILKDYLLKGYSINHRINELEDKVDRRITRTEIEVEKINSKIDFYIHSSLPKRQGIFFDGEVFDAYEFVSGLIRRATKNIILIDNYIDESVLLLLGKRSINVAAKIYTAKISAQLKSDISHYNAQYPLIEVLQFTKSHDRFLCIDDMVYHIGASIKDLGKKWFAFSVLYDICPSDLVKKISQEISHGK